MSVVAMKVDTRVASPLPRAQRDEPAERSRAPEPPRTDVVEASLRTHESAAVGTVPPEALRTACDQQAAQVFRAAMPNGVRWLASRLERGEQAIAGLRCPAALRASLDPIQRRRLLLQRLPYSAVHKRQLAATLDAFAALEVLDWAHEHAETPFAGAMAPHIVQQGGAAPPQGNDPVLGQMQTDLAEFLQREHRGMIPRLIDSMDEFRAPMPVLDATVDALTSGDAKPLADANVCVFGHVLAEAPAFMRALETLGADVATTHLGPVPYSSSELAIAAVEQMGFSVIRCDRATPRLTRFSDLSTYEGEGGSSLLRSVLQTGAATADVLASVARSRQLSDGSERLAGFFGARRAVDDAMLFETARAGYDVILDPPRDAAEILQRRARRTTSFAEAKEQQVRRALEAALQDHARNGKRIVVIDDGGYALEVIRKCYPDSEHLFSFVEQTTRGIRRIEGLVETAGPLKASVVDVAQSEPKRRIEAPFVGDSGGSAVVAHLRLLLGDTWQQAPVAILGYGAIGENVARYLAQLGMPVAVYDQDPAARERAEHAGFAATPTLTDALRHNRVVLGCTGTMSATHLDLAEAHSGTIFGSLSSADVEVHATNWVPWGTLDVRLRSVIHDSDVPLVDSAPEELAGFFTDVLSNTGVHANTDAPLRSGPTRDTTTDLSLGHVGHQVYIVLNGGFPLNLTRQLQSMPPERIQVTLACLVAGAAQRDQAPGLHGLELEELITQRSLPRRRRGA